jgi:hypothetical protein
LLPLFITAALPQTGANLQAMKNITDNHKSILAILAADTSEYFTYQQIANMTGLTADGVRGMMSDLTIMGYRFRKLPEGRKKKIQLLQPLEATNQAAQNHSSSVP